MLHRPMTRRQFFVLVLSTFGAAVGLAAAWRALRSSAATVNYASVEAESASASGATVITDSSASGGNAVRFGNNPQSTAGPVSFANLAAARAQLQAPADANYVMWNASWPIDRDLEDVFATELGENDILVLPERPQPYVIDSSEGFRAAGVASVTGRYGQLPIVSRYKNQRTARTWFAMARARRGILGLGPGAVIQMSQSSWTQEPQIQDKDSVESDGWISPGRYYTDTSGVVRTELVGSQEKIIESATDSAYFGNFTMQAHDLGGVAYNGIVASKGSPVFERLDLSGSWRGFSAVPNGEAGAIASGGTGYYTIRKCVLGTRDNNGNRVGSSPIMINSSTGGGLIEDTDASETVAGMMTIWNSRGKHTIRNANARFNWGPGLNLEKLQSGFELEWIGGSIWSDYQGNGGKTPKPSDQGTKGKLHAQIYAENGSALITFRGVDFDTGPTAGAINIQSYGNTQQHLADIRRYDADGNSLPVKVYGTLAG